MADDLISGYRSNCFLSREPGTVPGVMDGKMKRVKLASTNVMMARFFMLENPRESVRLQRGIAYDPY
jgi:hypothetical protein